MRNYNIAAIPGDGIGQEVVAAAVEVLLACAERDKGFALDFTNFDWGSERYKKFGALMPADGIETLKQFDAILFGSVGAPDESGAGRHQGRATNQAPVPYRAC